MRGAVIAALLALLALTLAQPSGARIVGQCDVAKELTRQGVSKTFLSHWICLIKTVSGFQTNKVTGPGTASSYAYGIFQISSRKYCSRGRVGGVCNKRCEDFSNDDITDDVTCAIKIFNAEGFKYWDGWTKKCKGQSLPAVNCRVARVADWLLGSDGQTEVEDDKEWMDFK